MTPRSEACRSTLPSCIRGSGIKVLEINSRPGDPEIINLLALIQDDFVDVCFKMIEGNLTGVKMEKAASVLTYKVPLDYGGYAEVFPRQSRQGRS